MSDESKNLTNENQSVFYQIKVIGQLDPQWTSWFEGFKIILQEDGNTLLTGPISDQSALHGLLKRIRDLGMTLISVNRVQL